MLTFSGGLELIRKEGNKWQANPHDSKTASWVWRVVSSGNADAVDWIPPLLGTDWRLSSNLLDEMFGSFGPFGGDGGSDEGLSDDPSAAGFSGDEDLQSTSR